MKKISTLFQRNRGGSKHQDFLVYDNVVPGCEWVLSGEGVATRKWDGTCCLVRDGKLYKRYELKSGKSSPLYFEPADEPDSVTGKQPGWVPVGDGPEDKWHHEAFRGDEQDGTYELIGPKVQGNPESFEGHYLIRHEESEVLKDFPRDFEGIKTTFTELDIEGVVFHHPDGRMAKIKKRDFGLKRKKENP